MPSRCACTRYTCRGEALSLPPSSCSTVTKRAAFAKVSASAPSGCGFQQATDLGAAATVGTLALGEGTALGTGVATGVEAGTVGERESSRQRGNTHHATPPIRPTTTSSAIQRPPPPDEGRRERAAGEGFRAGLTAYLPLPAFLRLPSIRVSTMRT